MECFIQVRADQAQLDVTRRGSALTQTALFVVGAGPPPPPTANRCAHSPRSCWRGGSRFCRRSAVRTRGESEAVVKEEEEDEKQVSMWMLEMRVELAVRFAGTAPLPRTVSLSLSTPLSSPISPLYLSLYFPSPLSLSLSLGSRQLF